MHVLLVNNFNVLFNSVLFCNSLFCKWRAICNLANSYLFKVILIFDAHISLLESIVCLILLLN